LYFMLLLAADTSGRTGSIALARSEESSRVAGDIEIGKIEILDVVALSGGTFSAQLVPQVAATLAEYGFAKNDIGGFAVAFGPGSFTGLRVGLAAIKGLAEILGKPITSVSTLEAVAHSSGCRGKVTAVLDAGRGEVYVGEYEISLGAARRLGEQLLTTEEFLIRMRGARVVACEGVFAEAAKAAGMSFSVIQPINAADIARIGWRKIRAGDTVSPEQLEANYIRRTDAEILARIGS
jgi:tRNA threonylcarbamoyladenosine biosynthesis protein TsaB